MESSENTGVSLGAAAKMDDVKSVYERFRQLIVWLGLTELAWISYWLLSGPNNTSTFVAMVTVWIVAMIVWLVVVIYAASLGFFLKYSWALSNLVAVVLVLVFSISVLGLIPEVRQGVVNMARSTNDFQLISIHILRLLAIGTIIKFIHRELPRHFVLLGSLPDFLLALSAFALLGFGINGPLSHGLLVVWHLIGFFVFFGAGISMFLSVPSPLRIYYGKPDTSIVFHFPMVLAPTFTVPLFMLAHLFALAKLFATSSGSINLSVLSVSHRY